MTSDTTMSPYMIVLIGVLIFIVGFCIYTFCKLKIFPSSVSELQSKEGFDPATIPPERDLIIESAPRTISMPSGPNSPSQALYAGNETDTTISHKEPEATFGNNSAEYNASPDAPDSVRHPERSYRPAPANSQTHIMKESGIGSSVQNISPQNYQSYSTDTIQNSGEFMGGVFANDTTSDMSYSTL